MWGFSQHLVLVFFFWKSQRFRAQFCGASAVDIGTFLQDAAGKGDWRPAQLRPPTRTRRALGASRSEAPLEGK